MRQLALSQVKTSQYDTEKREPTGQTDAHIGSVGIIRCVSLSRNRCGGAIIDKLEELERHSEALDVGTDSFDDTDDDPYDPTEFIDEDDEF